MVSPFSFAAGDPVRYVALGDSYTVGTGAAPDQSWPAVVTARLQKKGIGIKLTGNLGHNGWTTQNLIDGELPDLDRLRPNFVTLLIGTNDWVQGVDAQTYQRNLKHILADLLKRMDAKHILIVTIPDFSGAPAAREFSGGRDIGQGLKKFNGILLKEARRHKIKTVDLFPLSQTMGQDPIFMSPDGLHPSAQGYAKWADLIEPAIEQIYAPTH